MNPPLPRLPALLCGAALTLLAACDGAEPPAPTPAPFDSSEGLVPLAVGNAWTYARTDFSLGADTFEVRITGSREVEHGGVIYTVYERADVFAGLDPPHRWFVGNEPDGFYAYGGSSPEGDLVGRMRALPHPARRGQRYESLTFSYNPRRGVYRTEQTRQWQVVALDTLIAVGGQARTGSLYRLSYAPYDDSNETWDVDIFYVPGLGMVREQIWSLHTRREPRLNSEAVLIEATIR